jgi:uncharacterized protein (TIGR01244 family)
VRKSAVFGIRTLAATLLVLLLSVFAWKAVQVRSSALEAPNALWIEEEICIAGQPTQADLERLKAKGVRSVVNMRTLEEDPFLEKEAEIVTGLGMKYFHIPVAREDAPPDSQYQEFLDIAREPSNHPVFFHCGTGTRIAGFWVVYRVKVHGWSFEKAEQEAKRIGTGRPEPLEYARDYLARTRERIQLQLAPRP